MITRRILPLLISIFLIACKQHVKPFVREYLNEARLTNQNFTINPTRDTMLLSQSGIRIRIAQGTFSGTNAVTIEFKEALDFESILQAGLFTTSNGKALSSAGMFYFNTKENLAIEKPIGIEVPAKTALAGMKLFKGEEVDGKINWEDPQPVDVVSANMGGVSGKALFENNCASCHKIDERLTGPALAGVRERWANRWNNNPDAVNTSGVVIDTLSEIRNFQHNLLYEFTREPAKHMAAGPAASYLRCLKCTMNGAMMTRFPALSDADLTGIYKYIDDETERLGIDPTQFATGCDSCVDYQIERESQLVMTDGLSRERKQLVANGEDSVSYVQKVIPVPENADYYQFSINSSGWFNIDIFLGERENVSDSKLMVNLQGGYEGTVQVFLAIPSFKVLMEGTYPEVGKEVVFKYDDGSLPLPQNVEALIFVIGKEKERFYFAKRWFNTKISQTINIATEAMTKAEFENELRRIQQRGWSFSMPSSNSSSFGNTQDSMLREKEKLNPGEKAGKENCDCLTGADTSKVVYDYIQTGQPK
jgi:cytochrome c2